MANIRKRGNNKYQITVFKTPPNSGKGKRFYKTVIAKNKYEAKKKAAIFEAKVENNLFSYNNIIFAKYSQKWLDKKKSQLSPATITSYRSKLNLHILSHIGGLKLQDIKPMHILDLYDTLREKIASRTVNNIHKLLHSMLSDAVRWELLEYNILNKIKTPKYESRRDNYLEIEEAKLLLDMLNEKNVSNKYKLAIHLALFCGLRNGEIMGLEWNDIDFKDNTFYINRTSQYISKRGVITKSPKTKKSYRKVHFNETVKKLFIKQRKILKEMEETVPKFENTNRVMFSNVGGPMHPLTVTKWFTKFLRRIDFANKITLHGLRHTSATIMIYNDIDLQTIASRLGHSDATTTLKIYSHQVKKADKTAADKIENSLK